MKLYAEQSPPDNQTAIARLTEADIDDRVKYADIPTDCPITRNIYESLMRGEYYKTAWDYVIRDTVTHEFIGFLTWWVDDESQTATLEPVACLPQFRRRGIMKRALSCGLTALKHRGVRYVYVSTSIRNEKSQPLYRSVGFQKIGEAYQYTK